MKINLKTTLVTAIAALAFTACSHDGFTLEGTLDGGAGKNLWLEEIGPEGPLFIDSIPLDSKGHFRYSYTPPYRSLYNIHTSDNDYIVTLPDKGEKLEISGSWDGFSMSYNVKGSRESILLWQLQQFSNDGSRVLKDLVNSLNTFNNLLSSQTIDQEEYDRRKSTTDSIYRATFLEQQEYVCRFVEENAGSLATLIALYKPFNGRALIDPADPSSIDYYDIVLNGLTEKMPDNPHTLHFKNSTEHLRSAIARMTEEQQ